MGFKFSPVVVTYKQAMNYCIYLESYSEYLQDVMGVSEVTADRHHGYVKRFLDMLDIRQRTLEHLQEADFREMLKSKSAAVEVSYLVALKYFCRYLHAIQVTPTPITLFAEIAPPIVLQRAHPFYTPTQIEHLLAMPDTSTLLGLRDRTILQVLYDTGMRNTELRQLLVHDIDLTQNFVRVLGKRQKERLIPLTPDAENWLRAWLIRRPELAQGTSHFLFLSRKSASMETGISKVGLLNIVKKYADAAGLGKHFTPHSLRHAFASHMLENGANLRIVQSLLGHVSLDATQIYLQVRPSRLKALHQKFHPRGG